MADPTNIINMQYLEFADGKCGVVIEDLTNKSINFAMFALTLEGTVNRIKTAIWNEGPTPQATPQATPAPTSASVKKARSKKNIDAKSTAG